MQGSEIGWMIFVVILSFIILYQQRKIRKLKAILSSRLSSGSDKDNKPNDAANQSGD